MNQEIYRKVPGVVMVPMPELPMGSYASVHIWFTNGFDEKYSVSPDVRSFILEEIRTYWKSSPANNATLEFGYSSGIFLCKMKDIYRVS